MKRRITKTGMIKIPQDLRMKHHLFDNCEIEMRSTNEGLLLVDPLDNCLGQAGLVRVD